MATRTKKKSQPRKATKPTDKPKVKSTKAVLRLRVDMVEELLIRGASPGQIMRYSAENWKVGSRQTEYYIQFAHKRLEKASHVVRSEQVGKAIRRYDSLYNKAIESGDFTEARNCQRAMDRLLGLEAPTKFEAEVKRKDEPNEDQLKDALISVLDEIGLASSYPKAEAGAKSKS